jgi:hypothetical protein
VKKAVNLVSQHYTAAQPSAAQPPAKTSKAGVARSFNAIVRTGPAIASIRLAESCLYVYVSNLNPASDDEDLKEYLESTFVMDNIKYVKLLPAGRDVNSCAFVSF